MSNDETLERHENQGSRGRLYILSAPSGAGKSTLIQRLLMSSMAQRGALRFSVSHTTRKPRQGERQGEDYHFVSREVFEEMVRDGAFLEWAEVHRNAYGTALSEVTPFLERNVDVILEIDVQGAAQVFRRHSDAEGIFLLPPSYRLLEERLRRRGLDDEETIARRLAASLDEIARYPQYRHVIINDDVDRAAEALIAVVLSGQHALGRMREKIEQIIEDFRIHLGPY